MPSPMVLILPGVLQGNWHMIGYASTIAGHSYLDLLRRCVGTNFTAVYLQLLATKPMDHLVIDVDTQ